MNSQNVRVIKRGDIEFEVPVEEVRTDGNMDKRSMMFNGVVWGIPLVMMLFQYIGG